MKTCTKCLTTKPLAEFFKASENRDGLQSACKVCAVEFGRQYRKANLTRAAETQRRCDLKRHYGLTPEQYDEMLEDQGGVCAICFTGDPGGQGRFHVDHDHECCQERKRSCGKCIRGLICHACNVGLGNFQDDDARLCRAALHHRA